MYSTTFWLEWINDSPSSTIKKYISAHFPSSIQIFGLRFYESIQLLNKQTFSVFKLSRLTQPETVFEHNKYNVRCSLKRNKTDARANL